MSKPIAPIPADALPEGFRMTELGLLPADWQVVRLGQVVKYITTGDWGEETPRENSLPVYVLRGTDFKNAEFGILSHVPIRYLSHKSLERRRVEKGDILVELSGGSKDQPTGRALLITENLVQRSNLFITFSNFVKRIQIHDICIPEYLVLYWKLLYQKGATRVYEKRTTGIRNFKLADFLTNEYLPLPPLPEQRAIAHVLLTVQEAREATERVIAALKELKKSLMRHLFTYGPVPVDKTDQVELQQTELGLIPAHWRVVRLGEVAKVITGRTPPTNNREYWDGQIPFITPVDLTGGPISNAKRSISYNGLEKARPLPKGTVLVSCIGYIGKVGVVDCEIAVTNQQINALIPYQAAAAWFLAYALMNETRLLESYSRMTTVPILHKTNFERIPIPLPPLPEQQEIARILHTVDEKIEAEEKSKNALSALFKSLLAQLMSGRVRLPKEFVSKFKEEK